MKLINKVILIISPESWGENYVSKHHYTIELVKKGNKVIFFNPPDKQLIKRKAIPYPRFANLIVMNFPQSFKGLNQIPFVFRRWYHHVEARRMLLFLEKKVDIVWSFDPYRLQYIKAFNADLCIYHAMDDHESNIENDVVESADMVLAVSDLIKHKFSDCNTPCYKINHGVGDHFFSYKKPPVEKITTPKRINVGYVGNLHYRYLDKRIFKQIILENPEVQFCFIGPYENNNLSNSERNRGFVQFLKSRHNISLIGPRPSALLPSYLQQFDLFLSCYNTNVNPVHMSNSHKILEYLSTGKVVVSHWIDEYKDKRDLLEMVDNNTVLPARLKKVIQNINFYNSKEKSKERINFASNNTYANQIIRIQHLIKTI
tara:strand:+ start:1806 stop:2921 length:1116 start_codon:yes stop_codon:yes gene_type:complete